MPMCVAQPYPDSLGRLMLNVRPKHMGGGLCLPVVLGTHRTIQADHLIAANNMKMCGPVLCKVFQEIASIQHTENSTRCGVLHVPCTCAPPSPSPPGPPHPGPNPAPADAECPAKAYAHPFVPWVRAANYSNV